MENILIQKANYLADVLGYDVTIITTDQNNRDVFFNISQRINLVDLDINYYKHKTSRLWQLKKLWLKKKHRDSLKNYLSKQNIDICISLMDFDFTFLPKIKDGSLKVAEYHFSRYAKVYATKNKIMKFLQYIRTLTWKRILKKYDRFVVLTRQDQEQWGNMSNIVVIPNFIESHSYVEYNYASKRIISVGRADYQKGFDMLLTAWNLIQRNIPEWKLVIIGGGDKHSLLRQIEKFHINNVTLQPPTKDIVKEYHNSAFYVMSSRYEGLPLVLLEAMEAGLPIVSFACPCGPKDILMPDFGRIVKPNNVKALASEMLECANNISWRQKASLSAVLASRDYEKENIMRRWDDLFNSLIIDKYDKYSNSRL